MILFGKRSAREELLIAIAQKHGHTPIFDALRIPVSGAIVCMAWILSTLITVITGV